MKLNMTREGEEKVDMKIYVKIMYLKEIKLQNYNEKKILFSSTKVLHERPTGSPRLTV